VNGAGESGAVGTGRSGKRIKVFEGGGGDAKIGAEAGQSGPAADGGALENGDWWSEGMNEGEVSQSIEGEWRLCAGGC
jgi:hypothetical protein